MLWLVCRVAGCDEPGFVGEDDGVDAVAEAEFARIRVTWVLTVASLRTGRRRSRRWTCRGR